MRLVKHLLEAKGNSVYAIDPENPVLDAIHTMAEKYVGALLVMSGDELLGIVSERDYARKVILLGRSSGNTSVREIMSSPVTTVAPFAGGRQRSRCRDTFDRGSGQGRDRRSG